MFGSVLARLCGLLVSERNAKTPHAILARLRHGKTRIQPRWHSTNNQLAKIHADRYSLRPERKPHRIRGAKDLRNPLRTPENTTQSDFCRLVRPLDR